MTRVLIVADVVGGVRTFVRELTRQLAPRGVEVHLALIGPVDTSGFAALGAASCDVRDLRLEWMDAPWDDVRRTASWVAELSARRRPDLIHMNTFTPVPPGGVPVLLTVHSCVLTWWRAVHGHDAPPEWGRYEQLVGSALRRADVLVAPTDAFRADLRRVYGRLPAARVIRNGRSLNVVPSFDARERLVVSVGRLWDEAKNVAAVRTAAPSIDGRVVVIGPEALDGVEANGELDGVEANGELDGVEANGELDGVEATGELDEGGVLSWLCRAAVFAEPARYEPFGLSALEAALCGCALVLGDIPSLRELWEGAATFVAPDDPEALAAAVTGLLSDPVRRRTAATAAYAAARCYHPSAMADAYFDAYRRVISKRDRFGSHMEPFSSRSPRWQVPTEDARA